MWPTPSPKFRTSCAANTWFPTRLRIWLLTATSARSRFLPWVRRASAFDHATATSRRPLRENLRAEARVRQFSLATLHVVCRNLRTFSLPYFSSGYLCYFGGSTTFGQIVRHPQPTYNRDTLVAGFSKRDAGSRRTAYVAAGHNPRCAVFSSL